MIKMLFYADLCHLGLAKVFSLAAFRPKVHRNVRNEIESKNLQKQEMETPPRSKNIENKLNEKPGQ